LSQKIAYLISSHDDIDKVVGVCPRDSIFVMSKNSSRKIQFESPNYVYPESSGDSTDEGLCTLLTDGWYRGGNGYDLTEVRGVSIGQALSSSINMSLSSILREYRAFSPLFHSYDLLVICNQVSIPRNIVFDFFSKQVKYLNLDTENDVFTGWPDYKNLKDWLLPKYGELNSRFVSFIRHFQLLVFRRSLLERCLIFSDWTNLNDFSVDNSIYTNHRNLLKSALICEDSDLTDVYLDEFKTLDLDFIDERIRELFVWFDSTQIDEDLLVIIGNMIRFEVQTKLVWLAKYSSQIEDLYRCYKPQKIQLIQENFEPFAVALCLANRFQIPVWINVDGHALNAQDFPKLTVADNTKRRVSGFAVTSDLIYEVALVRGFSPDQMIKKKSVFFQFYDGRSPTNFVFDVIILTWVPNVMNPDSRLESPASTLVDVLQLAARLFGGQIAIKIKSETIELKYVQSVVRLFGLESRVTILTGRLSDSISKCQLAIGGLSSAIAESLIVGVPYYVFEPKENVFTERHHQSSIISRNQIHTTIDSLELSLRTFENNVSSSVIAISNVVKGE